jgi:hypothetical protein
VTDLGYVADVLDAFVEDDAAWRTRSRATGGPLRDRQGRMAPVPAWMRLDLWTDRAGAIPAARPDLGPCWIFTGTLVRGYGYLRVGKRKVQAYRINYERYVGPIPEGMLLDHLCRVRACVHPLHVEPATYSQNTTRSPIHRSAVMAARKVCDAGHPYSEGNTYVEPQGARRCRACLAEWKRRQTGAEPRLFATATHCAKGHAWPEPRSGNCPVCNRQAGREFRAWAKARELAAVD